ncbi:MAG: NUDIX domain-containing protein [Alphaproteobacteria bacterium]|nr:NUDIX domain-containing protein [Alphaproteobacteria bacterium]
MSETPQSKPPRPAWAPPENFRRRVPDGDTHERLVCDDCGFINYENPKIVVGAVCLWEDRILLARRAINPRKGYWTLPAGFMELRETTEEGAAREAWEEACARIEIDALLGVYSVPRIGQVQMMYRAKLVSPDVAPGPESLEVALFAWDEIPWKELAFPSVTWALNHWRETRHLPSFTPFVSPADYPGLR